MALFSSKTNNEILPDENLNENSINANGSNTTNEVVSSPIEIKYREKLNSLESLKNRATSIEEFLLKINDLTTDSVKSMTVLSSYVDTAKLDVENEKRLKIENAKISTEILQKDKVISRLETQVETFQSEVNTQKNRIRENTEVIEKARLSLVEYREEKQSLSEALEESGAQLATISSKYSDLLEKHDELLIRYENVDNRNSELQTDLENQAKKEHEVQKFLAENNSLLEDETSKHRKTTDELIAIKHSLSETRNAFIEARSKNEAIEQELNYQKNELEASKRKFDDRIFTLNSEIKNLSSNGNVILESLKATKEDNVMLKKTARENEKRARDIETNLIALQKIQADEREQLLAANSQLSDYNLRYNATTIEAKRLGETNKELEAKVNKLAEENNRLQAYQNENKELSHKINELNSLVTEYQKLLRGSSHQETVSFSQSDSLDSMENTDTDAPPSNPNVVPIRDK